MPMTWNRVYVMQHPLIPISKMFIHVHLSALCPLTENDVRALIQNSAKKSCQIDPIPTSLVTGCLDVLLPVIRRMLNSSLSSGYFPVEWKEGLVNKPLLKKPGLDSVFKNLRPVSNLPFLSKLTERAVFYQTYKHMHDGFWPVPTPSVCISKYWLRYINHTVHYFLTSAATYWLVPAKAFSAKGVWIPSRMVRSPNSFARFLSKQVRTFGD